MVAAPHPLRTKDQPYPLRALPRNDGDESAPGRRGENLREEGGMNVRLGLDPAAIGERSDRGNKGVPCVAAAALLGGHNSSSDWRRRGAVVVWRPERSGRRCRAAGNTRIGDAREGVSPIQAAATPWKETPGMDRRLERTSRARAERRRHRRRKRLPERSGCEDGGAARRP